ncbi:hypothetical protein [Luteimonas huabeiensis]|uniref:hypothetical protein n=1 Tax=Luteimonas huabeiensis TaxID=1244513 RepID=UPI00046736BF|nr:hypothetical protein [Luteimonas huabeiensis]
MGKSNSIEQQQRENQAFNDYVEKMRRDLDEQLAKEQKALAGRIEAHYRNYRDDNSLIASTYQHLTTVDEWSLDSVNAAISRCKTAIFGGQLPDGATRDTPTPEASAAIKAMANLDLLIANAAFDAVQSLLRSAGSRTETSVFAKSDVRPLAPGLTLFIAVVENSFSRKDFFRNKTIVQNFFVFDARFSIKEGQTVSQFNDLRAYEDQKQSFREQLRKIDDIVMDLDPTQDDYLTQLARYSGIADTLNARLELIDQKLQALRPPAKAAALAAKARIPASPSLGTAAALASERWAIVARVRSRFETALAARDFAHAASK